VGVLQLGEEGDLHGAGRQHVQMEVVDLDGEFEQDDAGEGLSELVDVNVHGAVDNLLRVSNLLFQFFGLITVQQVKQILEDELVLFFGSHDAAGLGCEFLDYCVEQFGVEVD
jgi:hypothetical protein